MMFSNNKHAFYRLNFFDNFTEMTWLTSTAQVCLQSLRGPKPEHPRPKLPSWYIICLKARGIPAAAPLLL